MKKTYQYFLIGTGVFQPADVGLQRIIKHYIRQCTLETMVQTHRDQLTKGIPLCGIEYYKSIKHLRNTSIRALVNVHNYLTTSEGRRIVYKVCIFYLYLFELLIKVLQAWEKCIVGAYNLSGKCLESPSKRSDLRKILQQDQIIKEEIESIEQNAIQEEKGQEEREEKEKLDDNNEDTAIPLSSVITDCLDLEVSYADSLNSCHFLVGTDQIDSNKEIWGDEEDIWAYNKEREHWKEGNSRLPAFMLSQFWIRKVDPITSKYSYFLYQSNKLNITYYKILNRRHNRQKVTHYRCISQVLYSIQDIYYGDFNS